VLEAAPGHQVIVRSAPGAAVHAGPGWWLGLLALAQMQFPHKTLTAVLDCADSAGAALAAIRAGVPHIRFAGDPAAAIRLSAMVEAQGCTLIIGRRTDPGDD